MYLLGKVFFKLFLNWAGNIRTIFHNLLVYRISLQSNLLRLNSNVEQGTAGESTNEDIRMRYKKLMTILRTVSDIRQQDNVSQLASNYEKEYYKRMRNKILQRKRNKKNDTCSHRIKINVDEVLQPRSERMLSDHLLEHEMLALLH